WEKILPIYSLEPGDDDGEESEEIESLNFLVERQSKGAPLRLGTVRLNWSARDRRLYKELGDVLRWRQIDWSEKGRPPSGEQLLRLLLAQGRARPVGGFNELDTAWASYATQLGRSPEGRVQAAEVFELIAPAPVAARAWVDAWVNLIRSAARPDSAHR